MSKKSWSFVNLSAHALFVLIAFPLTAFTLIGLYALTSHLKMPESSEKNRQALQQVTRQSVVSVRPVAALPESGILRLNVEEYTGGVSYPVAVGQEIVLVLSSSGGKFVFFLPERRIRLVVEDVPQEQKFSFDKPGQYEFIISRLGSPGSGKVSGYFDVR